MRALILTHGALGLELQKVVTMILGPVPGLTAISNHGKSALDLTTEVKAWLASAAAADDDGTGPAVIFIDDYGGSCANAARLACGPHTEAAIISGVNLAMVLGFVTWREKTEFPALVRKLVDKGREAITVLGTG